MVQQNNLSALDIIDNNNLVLSKQDSTEKGFI